MHDRYPDALARYRKPTGLYFWRAPQLSRVVSLESRRLVSQPCNTLSLVSLGSFERQNG